MQSSSIDNYIYVGTACSYPKELQSDYSVTALRENQTYPANPESAYGWSKLMGEYEADLAQSTNSLSGGKGGLNVAVLRFHNVYGPGMDIGIRSQVIPALIKKVLFSSFSNTLHVWGSGKQYRDFVYVDDIVNAIFASNGEIHLSVGFPFLVQFKNIHNLYTLIMF
jgi:nucleoside-diphosphate-sugar epimerase